jgi:hypothetical protein
VQAKKAWGGASVRADSCGLIGRSVRKHVLDNRRRCYSIQNFELRCRLWVL